MTRILLILLAVLIIPLPSWATTKWIESGGDATQGLEFFFGADNAATIDCANGHTGACAVKIDTGAGAVTTDVQRKILGYAPTNGRVSFYYRITNLPTATNEAFLVCTNACGSVFGMWVTSAGVLQLSTIDGANIGSNGSTLSTGVWYRISIAWTITSTTVNSFKLFVNGVQDITGTNATLSNVPDAGSYLIWGSRFGGVGASKVSHFDDFYWDDSNALTDPGDIHVTAKLPAANNVNTFDTAIGANPANRWTNVNERPLSLTNGWNQAGSGAATENYTLQAAGVGDVDVCSNTLVNRSAWVWAKTSSGTPTATLTDNGTDNTITLTTTAALYTVISDSTTYPSDVAGIGMKSTVTTADTILYEAGTLIGYTLGGGAGCSSGGSGGSFFLLGAGGSGATTQVGGYVLAEDGTKIVIEAGGGFIAREY